VVRVAEEREGVKEGRRQGRVDMKQDGRRKVLNGSTGIEEVLRVAEEK